VKLSALSTIEDPGIDNPKCLVCKAVLKSDHGRSELKATTTTLNPPSLLAGKGKRERTNEHGVGEDFLLAATADGSTESIAWDLEVLSNRQRYI